jgi:hypothetical protein
MKKREFMKTKLVLFALVSAFSLQPSALLRAATTIDPDYRYAYGANLGWVNARGDTNNGAVIGEYVCSGYIYSANTGWINLGDGSPTNQIYYLNLSADDFGVNHDGSGNLRGYAWGANIGWINFEATGAPAVDLFTGNLSGYAWSANCGWISLSNAAALVQTDAIQPGADSDSDGLPDAWEVEYFNSTRATPAADRDHDGISNYEEYLAGTDPADSNSVLRITSIERLLTGHAPRTSMIWASVPTRFYAIEKLAAFGGTNAWSTVLELSSPGESNATFVAAAPQQFYRVRAYRPLMP